MTTMGQLRIGIIARCETQGLGIQAKEFFDHIPCKALVLDLSPMSVLKQNLHWFPNQIIFRLNKVAQGAIPIPLILDFIKDIDVLVSFETFYDCNIIDLCRAKGVKTVLQLNYEFLEYPSNLPYPDLFAAPSLWNYNKIPDNKVYLPVPVDVSKFNAVRKYNTFVHIVGKAAVHHRNGTDTLMQCLKYVKSNIKLFIHSQHKIDFRQMAHGNIPDNVSIVTSNENKENYWDNYTGGVLVMPRKFGGLCLPMQEAMAACMPVIATDIEPNNLWLPKEWLVPATKKLTFKCKQDIDVYEADEKLLAQKIDDFCVKEYYDSQFENTRLNRWVLSWDNLKYEYYRIFRKLVDG